MQTIAFDHFFQGERGTLVVINGNDDLSFDIARIFYIYGSQELRGGHAHKKCEQVIISLCGSTDIWLDGVKYTLCVPWVGIHVQTGVFVDMKLSDDAILLVVCSEKYDKDDYIYRESETP